MLYYSTDFHIFAKLSHHWKAYLISCLTNQSLQKSVKPFFRYTIFSVLSSQKPVFLRYLVNDSLERNLVAKFVFSDPKFIWKPYFQRGTRAWPEICRVVISILSEFVLVFEHVWTFVAQPYLFHRQIFLCKELKKLWKFFYSIPLVVSFADKFNLSVEKMTYNK